MARKKEPQPSRKVILKDIQDNLEQAKQWGNHPYDLDWVAQSAEFLARAEGLIELLEVHDCGSSGGYDRGQPPARNLMDRYNWLREKYQA